MTITPSRRVIIAGLVLVNVVLLTAIFFLAQVRSERDRIESLRDLGATEYPEPITITRADLVDHDGRQFDRSRLVGKWSLVFF
ncbi:MAG: SCO family protein, partial [Sphingomonadales bacterium]|nr:SCO family protein [Sphingomonadales bacterium]